MAANQLAIRDEDETRKKALGDINDRFGVGDSVKQLQSLMKTVTQKEVTADTVNAACNCVSNINSTVKTAIMAARYLSDG